MNNDQDLKAGSTASTKEAMKNELLKHWHQLGKHAGRDHISTVWRELNLTIAQLKCLFYIESEESTNQKSLAEYLGVTPPSITGIIDRMVEQNMVTRHENVENRRMQVIQLTTKSRRLLSELKASQDNHINELIDRLSEEDLRAFLQGIKALCRLEEEDNAAAKTSHTAQLHHKLRG
jgi:DNA-binding MarR family transcriptional regulator